MVYLSFDVHNKAKYKDISWCSRKHYSYNIKLPVDKRDKKTRLN